MKGKIAGILVCTLVMFAAVSSVAGTINIDKTKVLEKNPLGNNLWHQGIPKFSGNLGEGGGNQGDADWYKCGTTDPPQNIEDWIYTHGNVGIGTQTPWEKLAIYRGNIIIDAQGKWPYQQAYLNLITLGDGNTNLGQEGTKGWHLTARGNVWQGADSADQPNDFAIFYWDGTGWRESFRIKSTRGHIGILGGVSIREPWGPPWGMEIRRPATENNWARGYSISDTGGIHGTDWSGNFVTFGAAGRGDSCGHVYIGPTSHNPWMVFRPETGNVGIGTLYPDARLTIKGTKESTQTEVLLKGIDKNGVEVFELGYGLDYSETFPISSNEISPGTVVIIDPDNPGYLEISTQAYDKKVAGIVAGAKGLGSGVRLGTNGEGEHAVALAGRVYCNVDTKYGDIEPGDLLTTSPTPGHAMVVKDYNRAQGAVLGKAMEGLSGGGTGQILVLVTLQ